MLTMRVQNRMKKVPPVAEAVAKEVALVVVVVAAVVVSVEAKVVAVAVAVVEERVQQILTTSGTWLLKRWLERNIHLY